VAHAASHSLIGPQSIDVVQQKVFEQAVPRKYSQQLMVDPALWMLPDGMREVSYKFISDADEILGSGKLDGEGKSERLFTDVAQAAAIEIDVNKGVWDLMVADCDDAVDTALSLTQIVFDYDDHTSDPVVPGDDDNDDPDLSEFDITA
jgi:type VI secretion system secreted protein VgrG